MTDLAHLTTKRCRYIATDGVDTLAGTVFVKGDPDETWVADYLAENGLDRRNIKFVSLDINDTDPSEIRRRTYGVQIMGPDAIPYFSIVETDMLPTHESEPWFATAVLAYHDLLDHDDTGDYRLTMLTITAYLTNYKVLDDEGNAIDGAHDAFVSRMGLRIMGSLDTTEPLPMDKLFARVCGQPGDNEYNKRVALDKLMYRRLVEATNRGYLLSTTGAALLRNRKPDDRPARADNYLTESEKWILNLFLELDNPDLNFSKIKSLLKEKGRSNIYGILKTATKKLVDKDYLEPTGTSSKNFRLSDEFYDARSTLDLSETTAPRPTTAVKGKDKDKVVIAEILTPEDAKHPIIFFKKALKQFKAIPNNMFTESGFVEFCRIELQRLGKVLPSERIAGNIDRLRGQLDL